MSSSEHPSSLTSRLSALAQRLGFSGRASRQLFERASALRLPFQTLPAATNSIWWQAAPPLHRLVDLPRNALSGPVQEDKAQAHSILAHLVQQHQTRLEAFDLRQINGLYCADGHLPACTSLEEFASSPACRSIRIISYKDFIKTISVALPRFLAGEPISLRQASWQGERLYWNGTQHLEAFACAIVYARLRGLEISLPAELTHYRLNPAGLDELQQRYHMLAMPVQAWSDAAFMALLLDNGLPYARLSLLRTPGAPEFLLLPKADSAALALGEGLLQAGAADGVAYLQSLPR